jgi:two-component system, response regulator RegA
MNESASPPLMLIVDDDETFREVLARAMRRRQYEVVTAQSPAAALMLLRNRVPACAIVDLRMPDGSGLSLVPELRAANAGMRILVLTGFASIATAVEAIKLGASNYLAKPADADQILSALNQETSPNNDDVPEQRLSVDRLEWEHIQQVLAAHDGNISATARALHMHRRTLQRKLSKKPVSQ